MVGLDFFRFGVSAPRPRCNTLLYGYTHTRGAAGLSEYVYIAGSTIMTAIKSVRVLRSRKCTSVACGGARARAAIALQPTYTVEHSACSRNHNSNGKLVAARLSHNKAQMYNAMLMLALCAPNSLRVAIAAKNRQRIFTRAERAETRWRRHVNTFSKYATAQRHEIYIYAIVRAARRSLFRGKTYL